MAVSAEHRKAQRRLAREIHGGTFKPSKIGAKARRIANELDKEQVIREIQDRKRAAFGHGTRLPDKWNSAHSEKNIRVNPETGNDRTLPELRKILRDIRQWDDDGRPDDWEGLDAISDGEYHSAFFYH